MAHGGFDAVSASVAGIGGLDGFVAWVASSDSVSAGFALIGTLVLCLVVGKIVASRSRSRL